MSGERFRVDRRTTLKWLAATMAAAQAGCGRDETFQGSEIPSLKAAPVAGGGYGKDPSLIDPAVPWPRTLNDAQLEIVSALADLVLPEDEHSPAASAVGVPDFIDEWVSAPYPQQREDRGVVLAGLEWLDSESRDSHGTGFAAASAERQSAIVGRIAPGPASPELETQAEFFRRFRYLAAGAFYTTEPGMRDVGYVGNVAIAGSYPGPNEEALAHLAGVLERLGLTWPG